MGEQYDPLTGQYYLRARYYNPVIARFTQEDTYYGDGLNLYTYCRNNPILNHDPTGHGTKENSPYSRKEQQYIDAGADPDTAKLATQCYPDANSKQDLYNKYKSQGYNATDAKKLANYEIVHGEERAKNYAANNVKKSGPDYTATSPRDNVNTDWRTQERLNAQKKASNSQLMPMNLQFFAAKGDESGSKSGSKSGSGSKFQEIFDLADNYTLSDDTFDNHILDRHGPNSTYGNKSHFNADFDIRDSIDSTLTGDNFIVGPNTAGREGYIFEQTFSNPIGTNSKGKPLYTLKVVIDEAGNVITAFPKK